MSDAPREPATIPDTAPPPNRVWKIVILAPFVLASLVALAFMVILMAFAFSPTPFDGPAENEETVPDAATAAVWRDEARIATLPGATEFRALLGHDRSGTRFFGYRLNEPLPTGKVAHRLLHRLEPETWSAPSPASLELACRLCFVPEGRMQYWRFDYDEATGVLTGFRQEGRERTHAAHLAHRLEELHASRVRAARAEDSPTASPK